MNRTTLLLTLALALHAYCVNAQQMDTVKFPPVSISETEQRHICSSIIGEEFEISIALPANYRSSDTTYPVLYLTDGNYFFDLCTRIARIMQFGHELPEILIVGIGYRNVTVSKWAELRSRDFTPTSIPDSLRNGWHTGGGANFLRFIREELMPFITKNYRTSADVAYAGHSDGGLFGLYVLFHEPDTFHRYIIGSPSVSYDSFVTLKHEADYAVKHSDLSARVFMSADELEERADPFLGTGSRWVSNMMQLANNLLGRNYPSLRLQTVVFTGETHLSVCAATFSRGLRVIFEK